MKNELKKNAIESVDSMASYYEKLADRIWETPELSLKEFNSAALYCDTLRELGFAVTEKLCGIETAFCGSYGSGRPVIGILGEFDALSGLSQKAGETSWQPLTPGGVGHGCGHNLLGVGSLAAAVAVKNYLEQSGSLHQHRGCCYHNQQRYPVYNQQVLHYQASGPVPSSGHNHG